MARKDVYQGSDRYPATRQGRFPVRLFVGQLLGGNASMTTDDLWKRLQGLREFKSCPKKAQPKRRTVQQARSAWLRGELPDYQAAPKKSKGEDAGAVDQAAVEKFSCEVRRSAVELLSLIGSKEELEEVIALLRSAHAAREELLESVGGDRRLLRRLLGVERRGRPRKSGR